MKQFRLLRPDEIECRVAQCNEKGASILLYKTARTDADLLDDDVVFKRFTNTPFSIQMLKGCIYGGILSNSGVIFSAEYLGISPAASGCSE